MTAVVLEGTGLSKSYTRSVGRSQRREHVMALSDVNITVPAASTVAVVGESGAGKSTLGRILSRLLAPDSGTIQLAGQDISTLGGRRLRAIRSEIQMIFQDPYSSLDPRLAVLAAVEEPLRTLTDLPSGERRERSLDLLAKVGISHELALSRPSKLSGGQLQRASIARALSVSPSVIVCDEPVAALDVSIQAQVLRLLIDIQKETGVSYVFISHDLRVVRLMADHVVVMRNGSIVETGPAREVLCNPSTPYTKTLLQAVL